MVDAKKLHEKKVYPGIVVFAKKKVRHKKNLSRESVGRKCARLLLEYGFKGLNSVPGHSDETNSL